MYSPKVKEELIPTLYQLAKKEKKPMTVLVNELIEESLTKTFYCRNCNYPIEAERGTEFAYCDFCSSVVFILNKPQ